MNKANDFKFLKRKSDGRIIDVPARDYEATLKRGGFEEVKEMDDLVHNPIVETPTKDFEFECPVCGRTFKTEQGLKIHKGHHNK